jgi:molybdate transport repressor ModE-like protein
VIDEQWDALELRHLATLRAIAEAGSFQVAAADLGHVPSVVSQQLAALEAITGMRLVERGRGRRTVSLTPAGEVLLRHADAIEARLGAARADLRAIAAGTAGTLRVGTYQSVSARILPSLLLQFSRAWPGVALEIRDGVDDLELLPLLESGTLDLAFSTLPLADGPFRSVEVLRDPWLLLTQPGSPLAARPVPLALRHVARERLVAFHAASVIQASLEGTFRANGLTPDIVLRVNESAAIHGLVASGFASALMPALAVDMADTRIARIPVAVPPRSIAIAWHADRAQPPVAEAFVAMARAICEEVALTLR